MPGVSGKLIGLKVNGSFVACETSCEFNFDIDMLPSSAQDSGGWVEYIPGIRKWTMRVNANLLLQSVSSDIKAIITTCLMNRQAVYVAFSTRVSSTIQMVLSGRAYAQSGNITAPATGGASWNVSFQGSGPLTTAYNDFNLLIDAMPAEAAYPTVVNTATT